MRISIVCGDKDFINDGKNYSVTLDGVKQTHCIMADSDKGVVQRYKLNRYGVVTVNRQGKTLTEVVYGSVVIKYIPWEGLGNVTSKM